MVFQSDMVGLSRIAFKKKRMVCEDFGRHFPPGKIPAMNVKEISAVSSFVSVRLAIEEGCEVVSSMLSNEYGLARLSQ